MPTHSQSYLLEFGAEEMQRAIVVEIRWWCVCVASFDEKNRSRCVCVCVCVSVVQGMKRSWSAWRALAFSVSLVRSHFLFLSSWTKALIVHFLVSLFVRLHKASGKHFHTIYVSCSFLFFFPLLSCCRRRADGIAMLSVSLLRVSCTRSFVRSPAFFSSSTHKQRMGRLDVVYWMAVCVCARACRRLKQRIARRREELNAFVRWRRWFFHWRVILIKENCQTNDNGNRVVTYVCHTAHMSIDV
jgi:hypothetical protein